MYSQWLKITNIIRVIIALAVVALVILFLKGYFKLPAKSITNFNECVAAGNPVMESYPRQCRADGQNYVETIAPEQNPIKSSGCAVAGCSGQLCVEADKASEIITNCLYLPEYACYKESSCKRQSDGQCGWTPTAELQACLTNSKVPTSPIK